MVGQLEKMTEFLGCGAYHAGVEAFGVEWSYGYNDEVRPASNAIAADYINALHTAVCPQLYAHFPGSEYPLVRRSEIPGYDLSTVERHTGDPR
jgi:hypothetical protein